MHHEHDHGHRGLFDSLGKITFWAVVGFLLYWAFRKAPKTTALALAVLVALYALSVVAYKSPYA